MRKGYWDFLKVAERMPNISFLHAGGASINCSSELGRPLPKNVSFRGRLSDEELEKLMRSAKVYLQLSRHEGFGCSVAEAMMCGCIPIVSDAYSLPEVVGDTGIILNSRDPETVAKAVKEALAMPESEGLRARQRILEHFSYEARAKGILDLVERL
jgi:glycosyltransferase involved in cell wall biosynthesis